MLSSIHGENGEKGGAMVIHEKTIKWMQKLIKTQNNLKANC